MHAEVVIRQPDHPDRVVRLSAGETRIGRAEDNEIVLSDVGVSRYHARVHFVDGTLRIEDLSSGNGTWHKDRRIAERVLVDGDEIAIDPFVLSFRRIRDSMAVTGSVFARIELLDEAGQVSGSVPLRSEPLTIGRGEDRDIIVADPAASRHHCTVFRRDGSIFLRDEGSANGVLVNGVRVGECALEQGDVVRVGNTDLRVVLSSSPEEEFPTRVPADSPAPGRHYPPPPRGSRPPAQVSTMPPNPFVPPPDDLRSMLWLLIPVAALVLAAVALGVAVAVLVHLLR